MTKLEIMMVVNSLIDMLECCGDGNFVDEVCMRVSCNDPFDLDEEDV